MIKLNISYEVDDREQLRALLHQLEPYIRRRSGERVTCKACGGIYHVYLWLKTIDTNAGTC